MKAQYEQLYKEMIVETEECRQMQMPETEIVASCFWIAKNHWEQLKRKIKGRPFKRESEEIFFFKTVKPKFTAQIQYFAILSEALLFIPAKKEDEVTFWEKEMNRYKWFCDKNKEFIEYYENGSDYMDKLWFIRVKKDHVFQNPITYDSDIEFCSSHDHLVRGIIAHKMYNEYCKKKLEELVESQE